MTQRRSLLIPAVFTAAGVAVLLSLGFWQLERKEWKAALLGQIAANITAESLTLANGVGSAERPWDEDAANLEYRRTCVEGVFLHESEMHLFATNQAGKAGYHVYTPLMREEATAVIINRGWVPPKRKDPSTREEGQVEGPVIVCGVLRQSRGKGRFTPENNPWLNEWHYPNSAEIAEAAGLETPYPALIDADEAPNPGGLPVGGQTRIDIPDNHLGYAITWFGLAAALLGVFMAFALSRR